jgi:hypothetical protein
MSGFSILYDILTRPTLGIRGVKERRSLLLAMSIIGLSTLSITIAKNLLLPSPLPLAFANLMIGFIFTGIFIIISLLSVVCLLHFVAEGLKGDGRATTLFLLFGVSLLPCIFTTPVALLIKATNFLPLKIFLFMAFYMVLTLWVVVLQIMCLKENYRFSIIRATVVYATPYLFTIIISLLLLFLFLLTLLFGVMIS